MSYVQNFIGVTLEVMLSTGHVGHLTLLLRRTRVIFSKASWEMTCPQVRSIGGLSLVDCAFEIGHTNVEWNCISLPRLTSGTALSFSSSRSLPVRMTAAYLARLGRATLLANKATTRGSRPANPWDLQKAASNRIFTSCHVPWEYMSLYGEFIRSLANKRAPARRSMSRWRSPANSANLLLANSIGRTNWPTLWCFALGCCFWKYSPLLSCCDSGFLPTGTAAAGWMMSSWMSCRYLSFSNWKRRSRS
mmetsp:Transcript_13365/g.27068  ORF Transcript_13365/g.27068 Transcript_13365/m.27068 type:complete len:248 (+) Transcript_13365:290-1033(+)